MKFTIALASFVSFKLLLGCAENSKFNQEKVQSKREGNSQSSQANEGPDASESQSAATESPSAPAAMSDDGFANATEDSVSETSSEPVAAIPVSIGGAYLTCSVQAKTLTTGAGKCEQFDENQKHLKLPSEVLFSVLSQADIQRFIDDIASLESEAGLDETPTQAMSLMQKKVKGTSRNGSLSKQVIEYLKLKKGSLSSTISEIVTATQEFTFADLVIKRSLSVNFPEKFPYKAMFDVDLQTNSSITVLLIDLASQDLKNVKIVQLDLNEIKLDAQKLYAAKIEKSGSKESDSKSNCSSEKAEKSEGESEKSDFNLQKTQSRSNSEKRSSSRSDCKSEENQNDDD